MTDLLVTVPKDKDISYKCDYVTAWWNVKRSPQRIEHGDNIFFIQGDEIRYMATFNNIEGRPGNYRIIFHNMKRLERPFKKHPGFRGFRYAV